LGVALAGQVAAAPAGIAAAVTGGALSTAAELGGMGTGLGLFAMSKLQIGAVALVAAGGILVLTLELNTRRALAAEVAQLQEQSRALAARPALPGPLTRVAVTSSPPSAAPRVVAASPHTPVDDEAIARLEALRAAGMKPSSTWENAGRATPTAAFETLLWAWHTRDYDALATLLNFTEPAKAALDAWFGRLPESVRTKFGSPERAIAPAYADMLPPSAVLALMFREGRRHEVGFKFVPVPPDSPFKRDEGLLAVLYSFSSDATKPETMHMAKTADGWRYGRWAESVVPMLTSRIDPATGELLPQTSQTTKP
jgi:hypothetical protein